MDMLLLAVTVVFRPRETFRMIKADRSKFNYLPPLILLAAALMTRTFYVFTVHFPLADINPWDTSIAIEFSKVLVPAITWTFACYAITSILGGESHLREILMATALCMVPYIMVSIFMVLLSHMLSGNEMPLYLFLNGMMWGWMLLLFFIAVKVMNEYTMLQTVGIVVLSILAMLLIWAVAVLVYALANQFILFITGLMREIRLNLG